MRASTLLCLPPRQREFYGLIHQFAAGQAQPALTGGQLNAVDTVQVDGSADFLLVGHAAMATSLQAKVQFDISGGINFHQDKIFLSGLGSGYFPQWIDPPRLIPRGTAAFRALVDDRQLVPAANTIRILHIGMKVLARPRPALYYESQEPYKYLADFTDQGPTGGAIGANKALSLPVGINSDADFEIQKIAILSDGDLTLDILATSDTLSWFSRPCHTQLLGGTTIEAIGPGLFSGAWPFRLPGRKFVPAVGAIQVTATDLTGASNRAQVIFIGRKLRPPGGIQS